MQIKPYPKNAKKHDKKQIEAIAKSIKEFGFNQPVVVDKKGVIIVGHGRYEAATKILGMKDKDIPIVVANLTPKQATAYRIADNKLNESAWDMSLVMEEIKDLDVKMIELTGFSLDKLSDQFADMAKNNKEVDIGKVASKLVHECPKCGFKFSK